MLRLRASSKIFLPQRIDGIMERLFIEPRDLADADKLAAMGLRHNPVTALVVPRPIAWISTITSEGIANLAPFSFSGMACQSPPMVMFCANASHAEGGDKDTLRNVRQNGEFVFNVATWELREQMNRSSSMVDRHIDEFDLVGVTKAPSRAIRPPRVAESPLSLECKVATIVELPACPVSGQRNTATFGEVVGIHIDPDIIHDGRIDSGRYRPLARLGYLDYATCGDIFEMHRPGPRR